MYETTREYKYWVFRLSDVIWHRHWSNQVKILRGCTVRWTALLNGTPCTSCSIKLNLVIHSYQLIVNKPLEPLSHKRGTSLVCAFKDDTPLSVSSSNSVGHRGNVIHKHNSTIFLIFTYVLHLQPPEPPRHPVTLPTIDLPPSMLTSTPTTPLVTTERPMTTTPTLATTKATTARKKVTKPHDKTKPPATTKAPVKSKFFWQYFIVSNAGVSLMCGSTLLK